MTLDNGWALIIATVIGVVLVWVGNLIGKHWGNSEEETSEAHERIEAILKAIADLRSDFHRYQTHVAENYAKIPAIERMEANIFAAIARIEQKIDRLQEKAHD